MEDVTVVLTNGVSVEMKRAQLIFEGQFIILKSEWTTYHFYWANVAYCRTRACSDGGTGHTGQLRHRDEG